MRKIAENCKKLREIAKIAKLRKIAKNCGSQFPPPPLLREPRKRCYATPGVVNCFAVRGRDAQDLEDWPFEPRGLAAGLL